MKNTILFVVALLSLVLITSTVQSQVTVSGSTASDGDYTTLTSATGAFNAINGDDQTGNNILITITADITDEDGTISLDAGTWTTITINPTGGASRTISGTVGGPMINLNGADNVTIDGLNTGGNSLIISNLSNDVLASTIKFVNDATNNNVTKCTISGSSTATTIGTIWFSTGTATGNTGNSINNCDIGPAGSNLPFNAIYSLGTSIAIPNTVTIDANRIFDYFSAATASIGLNVTATGNTGWTITNNKLYQTGNRIFTTASTHSGIFIGTGAGYTITGNTIGFANSGGTGTTNLLGITTLGTFGGTFPSSYTLGTAVLNATRYIALNCAFTAGGTVSSIQNNTIGGFALLTSSGAATTNGILCGINVTSGNANIGTTTGNTIGATTGNGSLYSAASNAGGTIVGIYATSTNTVNIQNNTIGAIDASGTTATTSGGFTGIDAAGAAGIFTISNNTIGNSTVDNIRTGYFLSAGNLSNAGTMTSASGTSLMLGIRSSATGTTSSITGNTLRGMNVGGTVTTCTGISTTGAVTTSNVIEGNFLGTAGLGWVRYAFANSGALTGISSTGTAAAATLSISTNDFRGIEHTTAVTQGHTYIGFTHATSTTSTINGNTFTNLSVNTSGTVTFISKSGNTTATGVKKVINNSIVTAYNKGAVGGGTLTGFTSSASSVTGSTSLDTNNNFSNITVSGSSIVTFWNNTDGASATNAPTKIQLGNICSNISMGTGAFTGFVHNFSGGPVTISRNTISGVTSSGAITGINATTSNSTTATWTISHNRILNLEGSAAAGLVSGIQLNICGATCNVFNNIIGDLRNPLGTSASTPPVDAVRGISLVGTTALSTINVSNNTIYLNATAGGANFSTSGIFHTTSATATTAALVLRNNIVFNLSVANGTGFANAYRRSSTTLTNFSSTSNKNNYYSAGTGTHNIFFDGTNSEPTIGGYKTRVASADAGALSENTAFKSTVSTNADFMKIDETVATECEGNGITIAGIVDDYFGTPRYPNVGYPENVSYPPTAPDIGANEFGGIPIDLSAPNITYTNLTNTSSLGNRILSSTITDASGVPTAGILQPRIYYRKNADPYFSSQGSLQSGSGTNGVWDFTIVAADMGGIGVDDVISYFVIAQDISGPSITSNPSAGLAATDVNTVTTAPTSPNTYTIVNIPMSGDFTVGVSMFRAVTGLNIQFETRTRKVLKEVPIESDKSSSYGKNNGVSESKQHLFGEKYEEGKSTMVEVDELYSVPMLNGNEYKGELYHELTRAEKQNLNLNDNILGIYATITAAVADVGIRGVGATDCRLLLTDALYNTGSGETFPIIIDATTQLPTSTSNFIIKPNTGVTATIGDVSTTGIFVSRAPYVVFDGTAIGNAGSRDLTITNTSTATGTYVIGLFNNTAPKKADNNTIKYCNITGGMTTVSTNAIFGIILNSLGGDYDNCLIDNNVITSVKTGMQIAGVSGFTSDNVTVSNNTIGSMTEASSCFFQGITVSQADNTVIEGNEIIGHAAGDVINGATGVPTNNMCGIAMVTGTTNAKIRKNRIHDFNFAGTTQGYGAFGIVYNNAGNATGTTEISNNLIYLIKGDGDVETSSAASMGFLPQGICIYANGTSAIQIYYNSVYMSGATLGASFNGSSACLGIANTVGAGSLDIRNNIFQNSMTPIGGPNPTNNETMCIWVAGAASNNNIFSNINYNDYFCDGNLPQIGYFSSFRLDLPAWQTASGQDASSLSANPGFMSTTDLSIDAASPNVWNVSGMGQPITTVSTDINGSARSTTVAGGSTDIGAYNVTPSSTPASAIQTGTLANSSTTTYTLPNGRVLGSIAWGAGGTVPTSVDVVFYSGVNPPGSSGFAVANGYWVITPTGGSGYTYDITLNYDDAQIGNVNPESDLRVAKSDDGGTSYTPFLSFAPNTTLNTITVTGLSSFSIFALGDNDAPLPVNLTSFTSNINGRNVKLNWVTDSEQNNAGFDVERKALTGVWVKAGFVQGRGTTTTTSTYSFEDKNLNAGKYNYRLKQIDVNGNFEYHNLNTVLEVGLPTKFDISQNYPNPFNPTTKVDFQLPVDSKVSILVYDMTGREIKTLLNNELRTAGYYTAEFNGSSFASGTYFYRFIAEAGGKQNVITKKMVLIK